MSNNNDIKSRTVTKPITPEELAPLQELNKRWIEDDEPSGSIKALPVAPFDEVMDAYLREVALQTKTERHIEPSWHHHGVMRELMTVCAGRFDLRRWWDQVPAMHKGPIGQIVLTVSERFVGRPCTTWLIEAFVADLYRAVQNYLQKDSYGYSQRFRGSVRYDEMPKPRPVEYKATAEELRNLLWRLGVVWIDLVQEDGEIANRKPLSDMTDKGEIEFDQSCGSGYITSFQLVRHNGDVFRTEPMKPKIMCGHGVTPIISLNNLKIS